MRILFKKATIVDSQSKYNGKTLDVLVENGCIVEIKKSISDDAAFKVAEKGLCISPGWVDLGAQICDPGLEHREDLDSAAAAAAQGGYTRVLVQPNTQPVLQSKAELTYLHNHSKNLVVNFSAIGALSQDTKGQNITEMADMNSVGAVAFSDGNKSVQSGGLLKRALEYVKAFDGIIINHPHDKEIARKGQIHEGLISTKLGLPGLPSLAENIMVQRDIALAEYTDSKLHLANISTAESVKAVKNAKKKGIKVTASVAAMNIAFETDQLFSFDPQYKVLPPLREKKDRTALIKGLKDGTIDIISSNHVPWEEESKKLEFAYAEFGALGFQTAYSLANEHSGLSTEVIVEKLSHNVREIFSLPKATIQKGAVAEITAFLPNELHTFTKSDILSKSKNSHSIGHQLIGKVLGVVNNNKTTFGTGE